MSSAAPSSETGIEKSAGQEGFFIYTSKAFDLWFKDANGAWSLYDSYGLADITDGVAFSWNTNTAAFVRTQEASHQISVFVIQTKTVGSFGNQEQTTLSSVGHDRLDEHSNYKRVRMQNSGHTGEAYAIAVFDANGEASYISAPVSGQREGKTLGWDENGALGWITLTSAAVAVTSPSQYWDGSSTSTQLGSNTLSAVTIDNTDGKYENGFFNFGTSGTKTPARVGTQVSLSTGIYTFSLWFKNKRAGSDFGSIIRQSGTGASSANYAMGTHQTTNELGLHKGGATNTSPGFGFFSSGYDMSSFEGDNSWNHLAVVADGSNSTFYVNGQQAGNVVANVVTSHFKELGAYDGNDTQVFAEGLDEVGYWDSALTAAQIATIYNSSDKLSVLAPPPEFTLLGDTTEADGVYSFDGNGDYLTYNGDFRYTDQITVSTWFKTTATGDRRIYSSHVRSAGTNGFFARLQDGTLKVRHPDGGNGELSLTSGLNDGEWHQLVITWEANTTGGKKVYVDGAQVYSNNSGTADGYNNSYDLLIGANPWAGNNPYGFFNGEIASFSVTNSVMTAQEVADDYTINDPNVYTEITHIEEIPGTLHGDASLVNGVLTLDGSGDFLEIDHSTSYDRGTGNQTIHLWFNATRIYTPGEQHHFGVLIAKDIGDSNQRYPNNSGWQIYLSNQNGMSLGGLGIYEDHNSGVNTYFQPSGGVPLNQWNHLAIVKRNSGNYEFHFNGSLIYQFAPSVRSQSTTNNLIIGALRNWQGSGFRQHFQGKIDSVTMINKAMSSTEIAAVYNAGAPE
jgi:hypothetical protein